MEFRGERRSSARHRSTTDLESRLLRKGKAKEAKLVFLAHALMENRNGIPADFQVTEATGTAEHHAAPALLNQACKRGFRPRTLGGEKNYDSRGCMPALRARGATPHVAQYYQAVPRCRRADDPHPGYALSQRARKRAEEARVDENGGRVRRTRYCGLDRMGLAGYLVATAYNLMGWSMRLVKLVKAPGRVTSVRGTMPRHAPRVSLRPSQGHRTPPLDQFLPLLKDHSRAPQPLPSPAPSRKDSSSAPARDSGRSTSAPRSPRGRGWKLHPPSVRSGVRQVPRAVGASNTLEVAYSQRFTPYPSQNERTSKDYLRQSQAHTRRYKPVALDPV